MSTGFGGPQRYTGSNLISVTVFEYTDGVVTINVGMASNAFLAGTAFNPRAWNGTLVYHLAADVVYPLEHATGMPPATQASLAARALAAETAPAPEAIRTLRLIARTVQTLETAGNIDPTDADAVLDAIDLSLCNHGYLAACP